MVILSIPRLDVLGCSSPFSRDIGPCLSPYTAGTQGKIGPHNIYIYTHIYIYIFDLATIWAMNWACALKSHGWVGPTEAGLGVKKNRVY